jgi:uncharacterized protein (DUF305 family)
MNTKRQFVVWITPAIAAILLLAGCGSGGSASKASSSTGSTISTATSTGPMSGAELDRAFIAGMVPHHEAAVDMARAEVAKGANAEVKALAESIIQDQEKEIATMTSVAQNKLNFTPPKMMMPTAMGNMMGVPMSGDMSTMGEMTAKAANVDHTFLTMMIPHHASAIVMADEERKGGEFPELNTLSQSVIDAQAREIGKMQQLLDGGV